MKIYYCKPWGFKVEASRVEQELKENFKNINIKLAEGKFKEFAIYLNNKMIYNKINCDGKFPKEMEITNIIKSN